jgi:hypothetical protein
MDNRRNGMHQIRVYIGSTISHGISESMADGPECRRREGPLVCPVRVNAKISVQCLSLQEVGEARRKVSQASVRKDDHKLNRGVVLWRRPQIFGPGAASLLARPFSLLSTPARPLSLTTTKYTHIYPSKPLQTKAGRINQPKMPQAQLKKAKTEKKVPAKPYDHNSSTTDNKLPQSTDTVFV